LYKGEVLVVMVVSASSLTDVTFNLVCTKAIQTSLATAPGSAILPIPWAYWPMDELSTFTVAQTPAVWYKTGLSEFDDRRIFGQITFMLDSGVESLANGPMFGPMYLPPDKYIMAFWKDALFVLSYTTQYGAAVPRPDPVFSDYTQANDLEYIRVCGLSVGEDESIHWLQVYYELSDGTKEYGTFHGTHKSNSVHHTIEFDDDEYITSISGSWQTWSGGFINSITITTNKSEYVINTPSSNTFTIPIPAPTATSSYEFMGFNGQYTVGDHIDVFGLIIRQRTFDSAALIPDSVTGWNFYSGTSEATLVKMNGTLLALTEYYDESV
jgi:hypothetical protein